MRGVDVASGTAAVVVAVVLVTAGLGLRRAHRDVLAAGASAVDADAERGRPPLTARRGCERRVTTRDGHE